MNTSVQIPTNIRPFHVDIPDEKLADLRRRIAATRWPSAELVQTFSPRTSCPAVPAGYSGGQSWKADPSR